MNYFCVRILFGHHIDVALHSRMVGNTVKFTEVLE